MNLERRDKWYGNSMLQCIEGYPDELPIDAVGLWQIVPFGYEGFNLRGDDLVDFTRRCIMALLDRGAKPVRGDMSGTYDWVIQSQYGEVNDEIADSIIAEWLSYGDGEPKPAKLEDGNNPANPGGIWFGLPTGGKYSVGSA
jgi:hypothetical protein